MLETCKHYDKHQNPSLPGYIYYFLSIFFTKKCCNTQAFTLQDRNFIRPDCSNKINGGNTRFKSMFYGQI